MNKARLILAVVFVANLVMYGVYRTVQNRRQEATVSVSVEPTTQPVADAAKTGKGGKVSAAEAARANPDSALARAHRVAGLAALEGGEYSTAVKEFTAALRLGESAADTAELLRIARDLSDKAAAREAQAKASEKEAQAKANAEREATEKAARAAAAKPAPAPVVAKAVPAPAKKKAAPVVAARASSSANESATGLLLVTSTPSGLLVEVDGRRVDFTPTRMKVETGLHTVAIIQGDNRLYERRVEVTEDGVHSIDPDLSEKLRPAQREEPRVVAPAVAASDELPEPSDSNEAASAKPAAVPGTTPTIRAFGELHVLSANVYGDVWINGESYGKPPLVARNIPSGPATIEVRVNGSVRRSKVVEVEPSKRTTIRLR